MAKAIKSKAKTLCQLRITLEGTDPPVWRRVLVEEDTKLDRLHRIIQRAMGWEDYHLYEFIVKRERFGPPPLEGVKHDSSATVSQVLARRGSKFVYLYDGGDNWEHTITLEDKLAPDPTLTPPRCIEGARACPPEDCGGVWGYDDILLALSDPDNEAYQELLKWVGLDFDPDAFDLQLINRRLAR